MRTEYSYYYCAEEQNGETTFNLANVKIILRL
jgi:hypothetical protein